MAKPTAYNPSYSFSGWQASNLSKPLPAQQVDKELAKIATSIGETIGALADIRRPDGGLKNGIVTREALSADIAAEVNAQRAEAAAVRAQYFANNVAIETGVTLRTYGALGDGVADDSAAWDAFIAACVETGMTGVIPPGRYRVPKAKAVAVTGDLRLVGDSNPIIDGESTADNSLFRLVDKAIRLQGMTFENFTDVITGGDGSAGSMPNTVTGDVEEIMLDRVSFINCRRPLFCFIADSGHALGTLNVIDCHVDGETSGWTGFYCAWSDIGKVKVNRNQIQNINATAAGGTPPANVGNGRAILIGSNNPPDTFAQTLWEANDNIIENVLDSRANSRGNPEVGGIRMTGSAHAQVCRNRMSNIRSSGAGITDDCEGIYVKTAYSVISQNVMRNVGQGGSGIILKGYNRDDVGVTSSQGYAGVCVHNVLVTDWLVDATGIGVFASDWIVESNYIEGYGGKPTVGIRYTGIFTSSMQDDNTVIRGNTLKNCIGTVGIYVAGYGKNYRIENNIIDGVLASATGLAPAKTYGILVNNVNSDGFNTDAIPLANPLIAGNRIGGVVAMSGSQRLAIMITSSGSETRDLVISGNVLTTEFDVGIQFNGGVFGGVTRIFDNDLALATDKQVRSGSPTINAQAIRNNIGWLEGTVLINPSSVPAGGHAVIGTLSITDSESRDVVHVSSTSSLSGLLLYGAVASAGKVALYLFNPTAEKVDVSTSTLRVSLERIAA